MCRHKKISWMAEESATIKIACFLSKNRKKQWKGQNESEEENNDNDGEEEDEDKGLEEEEGEEEEVEGHGRWTIMQGGLCPMSDLLYCILWMPAQQLEQL